MMGFAKKNFRILKRILNGIRFRFPRDSLRCSIAALALLAAPAAAQLPGALPCGPHAEMVASLIDDYGEALRGSGMAGPRAAFEVWASDATGSWTIMIVSPEGRACVIATGHYWNGAQMKSPGQPTGLTIPGVRGPAARPGVAPRRAILPRRGGVPLSRVEVVAGELRPGSPSPVARPLLSGGVP